MTTAIQTASRLFIPQGTIVGFSFQKGSKAPITGSVTLQGDCYITEAYREEDGCWSYTLGAGRTYYCAGGLATVLGDASH